MVSEGKSINITSETDVQQVIAGDIGADRAAQQDDEEVHALADRVALLENTLEYTVDCIECLSRQLFHTP